MKPGSRGWLSKAAPAAAPQVGGHVAPASRQPTAARPAGSAGLRRRRRPKPPASARQNASQTAAAPAAARRGCHRCYCRRGRPHGARPSRGREGRHSRTCAPLRCACEAAHTAVPAAAGAPPLTTHHPAMVICATAVSVCGRVDVRACVMRGWVIVSAGAEANLQMWRRWRGTAALP